MAVNYSNYPQYRAAFEKAQKLQIALYGATDNRGIGLASKLDSIALAQGEDSSEYKTVKARFDAMQRDHEKAAAEADAMRKEIDATESKKNKDKQKQKAAAETAEKIATLSRERDSLRRQNKTELAAAKQEQIDALNVGSRTTVDDKGNVVEKPLYNDYTLNADGSVTNKDGISSYFTGSTDAKGEIAQQPFTSLAKARDDFMKNYSEPGKIAELQKQLMASGYIKESDIKDKTWITGVDDLIRQYTYQSVSDVKYGGVKEPMALGAFLTKKKVGTGSGTKTYKTITTRGDAKKILNEYYSDLVGRPATPEELDTFYTKLHTAENKAVRTISGGVDTGTNLDDADRLMIAAEVARKSLRGSNVDEILKSNKGSQIALDITALQREAAAYGIEMPAAEALKRVSAGIGQQDYLNKQKERLRQLSMTVHPYLKDHIAAGGTVKDVADVYAYAKSAKLGVPVPTSTKDKDVMAAIAAGKTTNDFERELQANPLWRRTEEAHNKANDFVNTMLKTFGLVG